MVGDAVLMAALASAVGGIAVLRFAWSLPRCSSGWNAGGWGLLVLSAAFAWLAQGAWGAAIAGLWGMGAAMALIALAAARAPIKGHVRASNRASNRKIEVKIGGPPEGKVPLHILRRVVTFLIVALVAMIVSTGLALAMRGAALWAGASEANANVAGLFTMPIVWTLLAFFLLMAGSRIRQWRLLLLCAVPGVIAIFAGANV